jgi:hypothetical protein
MRIIIIIFHFVLVLLAFTNYILWFWSYLWELRVAISWTTLLATGVTYVYTTKNSIFVKDMVVYSTIVLLWVSSCQCLDRFYIVVESFVRGNA